MENKTMDERGLLCLLRHTQPTKARVPSVLIFKELVLLSQLGQELPGLSEKA